MEEPTSCRQYWERRRWCSYYRYFLEGSRAEGVTNRSFGSALRQLEGIMIIREKDPDVVYRDRTDANFGATAILLGFLAVVVLGFFLYFAFAKKDNTPTIQYDQTPPPVTQIQPVPVPQPYAVPVPQTQTVPVPIPMTQTVPVYVPSPSSFGTHSTGSTNGTKSGSRSSSPTGTSGMSTSSGTSSTESGSGNSSTSLNGDSNGSSTTSGTDSGTAPATP